MLRALYDYAVQRGLALPPGYVNKTIKYYIQLAADGTYLGLLPGGEEPVLCPDIGSLANGKDKCNPLAEKRSVILDPKRGVKSAFFLSGLESCGEYEPAALVCKAALEKEDVFAAICSEADRLKVKDMDRLSFRVGGQNILRSEKVLEWWSVYRRQFQKQPKGGDATLCLITGEPTVPVATVPPVSGLHSVGGHSKGDALICFDKSAFQSYDLKQSANAPVSEEAFFTVKAGLDHLLKDAPKLSGMKFVHWYDKPVEHEEDILLQTMGLGLLEDEADEEAEALPTVDPAAEEERASKVVRSVQSGEMPPTLASQYTILLLSGVNGRVMVRGYEHGSYQQLQERLRLWEEDLMLSKISGYQVQRPYKLTALLSRLLSRNKSDRKIFERMDKELPGLTTRVLNAITGGGPLPDTVAARALHYIRSVLLEVDEEQTSLPVPDPIACQWLKVWLLRKHRMENKEEALMEYYNPDHPETAYHCGALMCIYANIQNLVMPNVNASVIQRYYASAIQTPALVLGTLSRQSAHHQEKIEKPSLREYYQDLLCKTHIAMGSSIPTTLTLEQQSLFALGYYQMQAKINRDRTESKLAKMEKDSQEIED